MDRHTFHGKRKVGATDLSDFTDFQGIGRDPLYKRYASVKSLVDRFVAPDYAHFLAVPAYDPGSGMIKWYIDDWHETPVRLVDLPSSKRGKYDAIKNTTVDYYKSKLEDLSGEDLRIMAGVLRYIDDDFIYCADDKVFVIAWGMTPDKGKHISTGELIHESPAPVPEPSAPVNLPVVVPPVLEEAVEVEEVVPPVVPPPPPEDPVPAEALVVEPDKKKRWPWWYWLLIAIGIALLVLLILWLCGCFKGCRKEHNGIRPLPTIVTETGAVIEDNGFAVPIILDDGKLPSEAIITAPVIEEGGVMPEIIHEPGLPAVISDRLILFLEDENDSVDKLAEAFKAAYPGDQYSIIGYDRYVKSLTIMVPDQERETIKAQINQKIPGMNFIVFDETVYELNAGDASAPAPAKGWHLDAVKARQGWTITEGAPTVKVAVVDDGIDRTHSMFKDRIVDPYNVYTRTNQLGKGVGHGTAVAGLAVGSAEYAGQGAAGIAPKCSLMPVQVSDNNVIPLSSIVSGVMYSVHQDADVINVSIGPQLQGLNILPIEDQVEVSRTEFVNTAKMWDRVCSVAASKNAIIVFAAGNDDIISSVPPENRSSNCIVVGAVDSRYYPTEFTNYGYCTDISAPGEAIYSAFPENSFSSMDGTSFAAPIVTGTVALMRSIDKTVTVEQAKNVLYRTGRDVYGFMPPMVQIPAALQSVKDKDFSRGEDRMFNSVPGASMDDADTPYESWVVPADGTIPTDAVIVDNGSVIIPGVTTADGTLYPGTGVVVVDADGSGTVIPGSGTVIPGSGTVIPGVGTTIPGSGSGTVPGTDTGTAPGTSPGTATNPTETTDDYSRIRNRIKKLKQEIKDLESQLPENQR